MDSSMTDRTKTIRHWIQDVSTNGGIERLDHLHLDQIDPTWEARGEWIYRGLDAYWIAFAESAALRGSVTVALAFSLRSKSKAVGVDFQTSAALERSLDSSPPSLYLFHAGREPWRLIVPEAEPLPLNFFLTRTDAERLLGEKAAGLNGYLLEFRRSTGDEFHRSLFLVGK
jgi:hypothetical protein